MGQFIVAVGDIHTAESFPTARHKEQHALRGIGRSSQAIARAEAMRGKRGTAGQRAHALPMQEPGPREAWPAQMLVVNRESCRPTAETTGSMRERARREDLVGAAPARRLEVEASYDGGETWCQAPLLQLRRAAAPPARDCFIALSAAASDGAGNSVK
jgi:hypothetical protein